MARCRVLETCGASFLAILHILCTRMQEVKGPIGSISQKMDSFLPYNIYAFHLQWLSSLLKLADDFILTSERISEFVFPPSSHVLDKMDELAHATQTLPTKFEDALDKLPMIMQQVPFLDWALLHSIAWLKFLISALTDWGYGTTKEKEINVVDVSCNDNDKQTCDHLTVPAFSALETKGKAFEVPSPESSSPSGSTETDNTSDMSSMNDSVSGNGKRSYKEILTKGVKEDGEMMEDRISEDNGGRIAKQSSIPEESFKAMFYQHNKRGETHPGVRKNVKKGKPQKDQILRLFDASWSS